MNTFLSQYPGIRIVVNDRMTGACVRRTWKERLFSWPWKPWKTSRFNPYGGVPIVPDDEILHMKLDNMMIMNARTHDQFLKLVEADEYHQRKELEGKGNE